MGPEVVAGVIAWRVEDAPDVLEMYRTVTAQASPGAHLCCAAPDELPQRRGSPSMSTASPMIAIVVCHTGPVEDAEKEVAPDQGVRLPVGGHGPAANLRVAAVLDRCDPTEGATLLLEIRVSAAIGTELLAMLHRARGAHRFAPQRIVLFPIEGALNRLPTTIRPVGNRSAALGPQHHGVVGRGRAGRYEHRVGACGMAGHATFLHGGTYVNFLTEEEGDERIHAAYGANYGRLVEVKGSGIRTTCFA